MMTFYFLIHMLLIFLTGLHKYLQEQNLLEVVAPDISCLSPYPKGKT